eukprot:scaffold244653_cov36-Tisochrysis_lutea.AAC.1
MTMHRRTLPWPLHSDWNGITHINITGPSQDIYLLIVPCEAMLPEALSLDVGQMDEVAGVSDSFHKPMFRDAAVLQPALMFSSHTTGNVPQRCPLAPRE